jgi:iron(III) transport system permease protein
VVVVGGAGIALAALILSPLVAVLAHGTSAGIQWSTPDGSPFAVRISSTLVLLAETTWIAACVTAGALLLGVPLGLALARYDVPFRRSALALHGFPMFLPPFLLALGWFHLFGRGGLLGADWTSGVLFGRLGVVFVLLFALTPFLTWLVVLGVNGVDPALEDAARIVARPRLVARRILLPLTAPAVALGALVVCALAFSELGVPTFFRVRTYPAAVFARLGGIDYAPGEAAILSVPLVGVALGLLGFERWFVRSFAAPLVAWRAFARATWPLGRWRTAVGIGVWCMVVLALLPLAALGLRGLAGLSQLPVWIGASAWNSLVAAGAAATVITVLALVVGWAVGRRRPRASLLDAIAFLGFVTPAALLGAGLIAVWNRPSTQAVYGSLGIVVLGYVARYAAIGVRTVAAGVVQTSPSTEEAATTAGAGFLRRLVRIVLPEQRRVVAAAWVLAFVFALRDLETAVLFYPPGGEPLTVRIFTLEANAPESIVAALTMVHVAVTIAALLSGAWLLRLADRAQ